MFDYWKSLCLVQVRHLDSSLAQGMRATSSPEEWKLRGIKLFNEGNSGMATMCLERAGDEYREKWARAAGLYATADLIISTNCEMGETTLKRAADIYEFIGKSETAAMCYIKLKDFRKAGLKMLGTVSLWQNAGLLLPMYIVKQNASPSAYPFVPKQNSLMKGLQFLKNWKEDPYMDEKRHQDLGDFEMLFLESCALHFYEQGNHKNMMKFVKAFHSLDIIRSFLKSNGLLDELLLLEVEMGNYLEAATVSKIKGDILQEVEMLEKACHFQEAAKLILFDVVVSSLWAPGSKGWSLRTSSRNDELLMKAKLLVGQESDADSFYRSVCSEVYIFARHLSEAIRCQNVRLEVFIERSILDFHVKSEPSKYIRVTEPVLDVKTHK